MHAPPLSFGAAFERTQGLSQYVRRVAAARPEVVREIERRGAAAFTREEMRSELGAGEDLAPRLRRLRERVMVTLAHRDLNDLATLEEVFATMSALAEESIAAAVVEASAREADAHGAPGGDALIVAALGKLGGCELNVSSDVDLIFLHAGDGDTAGPRAVSHAEFFAAVGRRVIALLSEVTGEGQAFRVDMRLRPFGDSGPLVTSLGALEEYFFGHARPWERYAWLKARVVAGPEGGLGERVLPFVYRRYLDYSLLESLREMHGRIFEAAVQRRKADDIKVGAGGIREIEFAVQLFQMVRGGREPALRTTSTRRALAVLGERDLMGAGRVRNLGQAYEFLRRLEHRLQYYDDQQTQALPRDPAHRAIIAAAMGYADWEALARDLGRHRANVQEAFAALFEGETARVPTGASLTAWLYDPQAAPDPVELAEQLREAGIAPPEKVAQALIDYTRSRRFGSLSAGGRSKVERLLPEIVAAAAQESVADAAALRLIGLMEAIERRETYFSLLLEHPQVLRRAAHLMVRSRWAARLLARHPILLDELTRTAASFAATDWRAERASLAAECAALSGDVERLLDHLRHFKQRHMLRFTIADIEGELPVMALSDELAMLADTILDVTVVEAARSLGLETGDSPGFSRLSSRENSGTVPNGFCVVGYGKLGGKELGYASDLDVIFLYDEAGAGAEQLARVAQRVNTWMTSHTAAGVLYDIDMRLRPDGASGLMVGSIAAFREYQQKRAWTWEHQALTRARACAGDRALGARFEALRDEILAQPRDREKLLADIAAMRSKMRAEHRASSQELKNIEGGIIDLEFCVQALVLAEGPAHPGLRENKGNHTLLHRAGELGLLDRDLAAAAAGAYLAMRRRAHQAALDDEDKVTVAPGELEDERTAVKRLWKAVLG